MKHSSRVLVNSNKALFRFQGLAPDAVFSRLPELRGRRIHVTYRPKLTAWKGELLSRSAKGDAVYAGSFLRKRRIVLEEQMLKTPRVLERIFVHEVFHFVWSRLSRDLRDSFEDLISSEIQAGIGGELGWSAESMKMKLTEADIAMRNRRWKDYACESFCDTAGWYFGSATRYSEMTLERIPRDVRRRWLRDNILTRPLAV